MSIESKVDLNAASAVRAIAAALKCGQSAPLAFTHVLTLTKLSPTGPSVTAGAAVGVMPCGTDLIAGNPSHRCIRSNATH